MKYSQVVRLVTCVGGAAFVSAIPIGPEYHSRRDLGLDATPQGYPASQGSMQPTRHNHCHTPHHSQQVSSQFGTNDPIHVYGGGTVDPNSQLSHEKQKELRNAQVKLKAFQKLADDGGPDVYEGVQKYQTKVHKIGSQPQASGGWQMPAGASDQHDANRFGARDLVQGLDTRHNFNVYDTRNVADGYGGLTPINSLPTSSSTSPSKTMYQRVKKGGKAIMNSMRRKGRPAEGQPAVAPPRYEVWPRAEETAARGEGSGAGTGGASGALSTRHLDEDVALVARDIFEKLYARYFDEMDELD